MAKQEEKTVSRSRPNLLFIYTDEQRYDTLRAYGNYQIDMPEECENLADDPTYNSRKSAMRRQVQEHMSETQDVLKKLGAQADPGVLSSSDETPKNTQPGHTVGMRI